MVVNQIKVCSKLCGDCPFSKHSVKGFLADYSLSDIRTYMNNSVYFPCHRSIEKDMTIAEAQDLVTQGKAVLCKGYMESMAKTCITPRDSVLAHVKTAVKSDMCEESMNLFEFWEHHDKD